LTTITFCNDPLHIPPCQKPVVPSSTALGVT
jgi:hypothetical protein